MKKAVLWSAAVGCTVIALLAGSFAPYMNYSARAAREKLLIDLENEAAKAEDVARRIPKGCPVGVNADAWNKLVEEWRTETAKILEPFGLAAGFAPDKGDYPHACALQWVVNRNAYFQERLSSIIMALSIALQ